MVFTPVHWQGCPTFHFGREKKVNSWLAAPVSSIKSKSDSYIFSSKYKLAAERVAYVLGVWLWFTDLSKITPKCADLNLQTWNNSCLNAGQV